MRLSSWLLPVFAFGCPGLALAWTSSAPFHAVIHHHEFTQVEVHDDGCRIAAKLKFTAPESAYREPAEVRNYYRFKARLRFASGKTAVSGIFFSKRPGNQQYEFSVDTTGEACWARTDQKIIGVDVEGCRGQRCTVQPFQ